MASKRYFITQIRGGVTSHTGIEHPTTLIDKVLALARRARWSAWTVIALGKKDSEKRG